ncbi:PPA1309 family protein [Cutibacterium equinum]|uniref:PPA1309 family protein n=2 Tax=Cutibacterium equinum TaxID=3016342 RepID=A0ABY7R1D2_9ACTN|nr:PPA1309 family protein [Cutibacterium equinum]WCC81100.1 PPA1309 family protein [Cutibacterium equinum]
MCQDADNCGHENPSVNDALVACLTEIERFVGKSSWGGPPRLFALVRTVDLVKAEPSLAGQLAVGSPDSLSSIEQDDFNPGEELGQTLATTTWGDAVDGAAICVERVFLPDECADEIPDDPDKAAAFVAGHPKRQEVRVVAGALRDGSHYGVARLVEHPDDLLGSVNLVPALESAVLGTLR